MASSTLHVKPLGVAILLVSAITLTGCSWFQSSVGGAERHAKSGIVSSVNFLAAGLGAAVFGEGEVPASEYLSTLVTNVLLDPASQTVVDVRRGMAIYGLDETEAAATIKIFVPSTGEVDSGIYNEFVDLFGCGELRADLGTQKITLADAPCPDWILQWNGDTATEVSLTGVFDERGEEVTW